MKDKKLFTFRITAGFFIFTAWTGAFALLHFSNTAFVFLCILLIPATIAFISQIFNSQKNIYQFIAEVNDIVSRNDGHALYCLPAPVVIMDEDGKVVWYNTAFSEAIDKTYDIFGCLIQDVTSIKWRDFMKKGETETEYNGRHYRVKCVPKVYEDNVKLYICYFEDITELFQLETEYKNTRPSFMIIMIDNFEDLLQNVKESEKAHVLVAIEQLLEEFMSKTNGVLRKVSNDKFIAIVEEQHLLPMMEERFKVLDEARKITVGERLCVTLSIGVGHGADTLAESEVFAKQALDMSLGRGGDQVAVKTENGFQFFGGVSKGIEKQSKIKSRIIATAMQELISNSEQVFLMGHHFGDLDSVGSATGLAGAIKQTGKPAFVVVDPVKNLSKPLINRLIETEGKELFMDVDEALMNISEDTLLIIVDTHNKDFIESRELYERARQVIVIDHHRKTVNFIDNAVIFHHEPYASSACEMVSELIQYFPNPNKLSSAYAEALLSGIMLDTKNFIMKTGVRTFEAAAFLRKMGADTVAVKSLFSNSIETYQRKAQLVASAEVYNRCAIASTDNPSDDIRVVAPQSADELLNITNVDASFVIYSTNNCINISARSMGAMNVQLIMERLGGGGHQTMAATQLYDTSIADAKQSLIHAIDDYLETIQN